jgi:hypothetical protein
MSLKAVLASKAELDALPEAVRKEYVERDGKIALDLEGGFISNTEALELKTKLSEFRDNNRKMFTELEELRPVAKKFEGVDPEEYKQLKIEIGDLRKKGVSKPDDVQQAIDKAVAAAVKPVTDALNAEKASREAAQRRADEGTFRELVSADATKAGVSPTALRHVLREAESMFSLKDGSLVPKEGVKHPTDPLKELTPNDWLQNLAKTDAYLFATSNGSGAPGGTGGSGRPGTKRLINPSPEEMGQHMDAIAKGEMIVVRQ